MLTALPVCAAAAFLLLARPTRGPVPEPSEALGVKGNVGGGRLAFKAFARRDERVFLVRDGERLAPGDAVRFAVEAPGFEYLLVASIDGAGTASVYFPFRGQASGRNRPEATFEVPGSIVLDAAPGPERVFAISSAGPIESTVVKAALETLGAAGPEAIRRATELPIAGTIQASVLFEKQTDAR